MEKQRRIIIFGNSLILGTVSVSLQRCLNLDIVPLSTPLPTVQELITMSPDVIIFDLEGNHPNGTFSILRERPDLMMIGLNPSSKELLILTCHSTHAFSMADLINIIQS